MSASLTSDLSYNTNNTICCQHIILNFFDYFHFFGPLASAFPLFFPFPDDTYTDISVLYTFVFHIFSAYRNGSREQNKTAADKGCKEAKMRREREKEKDSYTTKGRDIPTLRGGGFTYSTDHRMTDCGGNSPTDCGGNSPSQKNSSKSQHSMKSGTQSRMTSGMKDSASSGRGKSSASGMRSQATDRMNSVKSEDSGRPSDCR